MTGLPKADALLALVTQVHQALAEALPNTTDPELRQYLEPLVEDLGNHRAELADLYPKAVKDLEARRERLIQQAAELQRAADEWQARIDAMEADAARTAAAPPAPKPAAPTPPKKQAPTLVQPTADADAGSVWKDADQVPWEASTHGGDVASPSTPVVPPIVITPPVWDPNASVVDFEDEPAPPASRAGDANAASDLGDKPKKKANDKTTRKKRQ